MSNRAQRSDHRLILVISLAVLLTVILAGLILRPRSRGTRPNVLWITMDSLRPDHLGCYGYPEAQTTRIDELAGEGFLFADCIAQAPYTHISVPSMITGKYPAQTKVRKAGDDLDSAHTTLAELLHRHGYLTYGILQSWPKGFQQGFEKLAPISRSTDQKTKWCLDFLSQPDDRPFFIWLYYWDPHLPYTPPAEFMKASEPGYTAEDSEPRGRPSPGTPDKELRDRTGLYGGTIEVLTRINESRIELSETEREHLIHLYDAEIAFVDSRIEQVVARIKELGLWDDTMLILNADHGEGFGEHGKYYHGLTLYEDQVRVPLIIKPPQSLTEGKNIRSSVRNMDIMPTILDYCGVRSPQDVQGQSLRPYAEGKSAPNLPSCLETFGFWKGLGSEFQLVGYRRDGYKLIYDLVNQREELYHLVQDPGETVNLLSPQEMRRDTEDIEAELRRELFTSMDADRLADLKISIGDVKLDRGTLQRLKALGYVY